MVENQQDSSERKNTVALAAGYMVKDIDIHISRCCYICRKAAYCLLPWPAIHVSFTMKQRAPKTDVRYVPTYLYKRYTR